MRVLSFQAEEGREWVDQEGRTEERKDDHYKAVAVPFQTGIGHKEEQEKTKPKETFVLPADGKQWQHRAAASQLGKQEMESTEIEEVDMEKAASQPQNLENNGIVISDRPRPGENKTLLPKEEVPISKNSTSIFSSNTNASRDGFDATIKTTGNSVSGIGSSNHGLAENVSTSIIPVKSQCLDGNKISCRANTNASKHERGSNITRPGTMYTARGADSFNRSRLGFVLTSRVLEGQFGTAGETSVGTQSNTSNFEIDLPVFSDVQMSGKSRVKSNNLDPYLWGEQDKSVNKSLDTKAGQIPWQPDYSIYSKGLHGHPDKLHHPQIRELESEQSTFMDPVSVVGSLDESDFDFGIGEDEAPHWNHFTRQVQTKSAVPDLSSAIPRIQSASPGPFISEQAEDEDSPSHSTVLTFTSLQSSESSQLSEREWAELLSGWALQNVEGLVEQPTEVEVET